MKELSQQKVPGGPVPSQSRIRREGAGRKRTVDKDPTLRRDLDRLVDPATRGDPESPLRWTCKSVRILAEELRREGHAVSYQTAAELLHEMDYSLQANQKKLEGAGLVQDLYAAHKENRTFLHARFGVGSDALRPYKEMLDRWLWPDVLRNQDTSVAKAKQAISSYRKAVGDPAGLAEPMVFYCERAASQTC